jgi:hypothetical protein
MIAMSFSVTGGYLFAVSIALNWFCLVPWELCSNIGQLYGLKLNVTSGHLWVELVLWAMKQVQYTLIEPCFGVPGGQIVPENLLWLMSSSVRKILIFFVNWVLVFLQQYTVDQFLSANLLSKFYPV